MDTEERNRVIAEKLEQGLSLSELQKLLADEYNERMTYLELRLLAAELNVDWSTQDEKKAAERTEEAAPDLSKAAQESGGTKVTVSKVVRPGASMSGDVEFASGAKAEWFVDSMGRLGINPEPGSSKPTEEDLREFQTELQRKLTGQ